MVSAARRHPVRAAVIGLALAVSGFALYWFAPWNLVIDVRVDEALPGAVKPDVGAATGEPTAAPGEGAAVPDQIVTLALGSFSSLEHDTSGRVRVVELGDGSRFVRLDDLQTSNGPDLRVWLSSVPAQDDWYVYDDGVFVDLGALKGNIGSSNYAIPPGVDLSAFETAVIWCRRFSVGFGVAALELTA